MDQSSEATCMNLQNFSFPPSFYEDEVRDGFFVSGMMKRYWAAELTVLAEIDRVCKAHDIPWYMDSGTLLGAVRHHGFIPWDDDIDIIMMRHDLDRFLAVAPSELPQGFLVCDIQQDISYDNTNARVINSDTLDTSPERMKQFHGCPYTVGIDVLALDGVFPDPEEEIQRRLRLQHAYIAAGLVAGGHADSEECQSLLRTIEEECHVAFHDRSPLFNQLLRVQVSLFRPVPSEKADVVSLFFGMKDTFIFPAEKFESTVLLPFEGVALPAPVEYDHVLQVYFGDYHKIVKGGASHDYPSFSRQEGLLRREIGCNPYRYTLTANDVSAQKQDSPQAKITRVTGLLQEAQQKVQSLLQTGATAAAQELACSCKTLADHLETLLAGQKEIVFLIPRAAWWRAMAEAYRIACSLPGKNVIVIPVPWYEKNTDGGIGARHDERSLFPAELSLTMPETYDIAARMPSTVITCFPYDNTNRDISVDPLYHTQTLRHLTDRLIYIPCHDADTPAENDTAGIRSLRVLIEQPAVVFSDTVVVKDEGMKHLYVETLSELAGEESRSLWEGRITSRLAL